MFFSLNFRSRTLLPPRRDLWKRRRCWSRHRRGTDRPQPLLWQPLRNRVVRWYFMSVAESVHLRSNGLQCNELNQGLLKFNWPITAFVRSEDGCSKIVDGPGCVRWTVSIDELSNQSMNTSISQKPKSWISLLITPASLFHVLSSGVSPLDCLATQSTLQPCFLLLLFKLILLLLMFCFTPFPRVSNYFIMFLSGWFWICCYQVNISQRETNVSVQRRSKSCFL